MSLPSKRSLSVIQTDLERADEEARIALERVNKYKEEQRRNEDFQRQEEFRRIFKDPRLYSELFEGEDALIKLHTVPVEKVKKIVGLLKDWKDKEIKEVTDRMSRATRVVIRTEEVIDNDPYNGEPYKSILTYYSDGTSAMSYVGKC